jgi:hypothetical protein
LARKERKLEDLRLLQRRKPIIGRENPADGRRSTYSNRSANITQNAMH